MRVENGIVSPSINLFIRNIHRHRTTMMISWQSVILELDIGSPIRSHQMKMKTNSKMRMMKWLGSDSDRPFFGQFVNQCASAYWFHFYPLSSSAFFYIMISFLSSEPMRNWQVHPKETPPVKIQWIRELPDVIGVAFLYMWFFAGMLFLFRRIS